MEYCGGGVVLDYVESSNGVYQCTPAFSAAACAGHAQLSRSTTLWTVDPSRQQEGGLPQALAKLWLKQLVQALTHGALLWPLFPFLHSFFFFFPSFGCVEYMPAPMGLAM